MENKTWGKGFLTFTIGASETLCYSMNYKLMNTIYGLSQFLCRTHLNLYFIISSYSLFPNNGYRMNNRLCLLVFCHLDRSWGCFGKGNINWENALSFHRPLGKPVVHFLDWWLIGIAFCCGSIPGMVVVGALKNQPEQASESTLPLLCFSSWF